MLDIEWRQCACHVWPIVRNEHVGQCGECGVTPIFLAAAPASGRAERLPCVCGTVHDGEAAI